MTGFIVSVFPFRNRVSFKEAFEGLELGEGKLSRPVLRGLGGRKAVWLLGSHVTAPPTGSDFRMDVCDLIVSMEQAEISPRPVVGAIVVVSGLAVSFLLWLLYVHHASADFAERWIFLPARNAL